MPYERVRELFTVFEPYQIEIPYCGKTNLDKLCILLSKGEINNCNLKKYSFFQNINLIE